MSIFHNGHQAKNTTVRFKEVLTPHKISVLILIHEYCSLKTAATRELGIPKVFGEVPEETEKLTQKEMRGFMIGTLKLLQSSDMDLNEFIAKQKMTLNPKLMDTLKQRLKEIYIGGIHPLCDFFEPISKLLTGEPHPVMTRNSVLGVFIRRMVLAYEKLTFNQVIQLYDQFRAYYEQYTCLESAENSCLGEPVAMTDALTDSMMELSAIARGKNSGQDVTHSDSQPDSTSTQDHNQTGGFYSQKQAEYFIVMQGFRMQYNENEALPPKQLQEKITEMLRTNPELAEAHFLSYLNSLRVNEFCTALHNLYHYFDRHTPIHTDNNPNKGREEDVSRRFAALNLASLHFRFGHKKQARAALDEAISMAQESNDHVCLQHALGWLYRLSDVGTKDTGNLLERSVVKTQEHNLPYLASLGVQAFARHNALSMATPSSIFEFIVKSDVLNCQYSQSGFMCVSCVHKAALWQMYGKRESSLMYNQLALNMETSDCGLYYNGELSCIAICNMAKLHCDQGDWASMTELLNHAKRLFPSHTRDAHIWMSCEQEITYTRAMHCGNWMLASRAIQNLKAVNPLEGELRDATLKKNRGETTAAVEICENLIQRASDSKEILPEFKCRVYLVLAELHCETDCYTSAISPLLECITLAQGHHLSYILAMASCYMAYVQLCMSLPSQAVDLLDSHMTMISTNGSLYDRARIMSLYTKCRLAQSTVGSSQDRNHLLEWAVITMNDVVTKFRTIDATIQLKKSLYYLALLHNQIGNMAERNGVSREFKKLDQLVPNLSPVTAKFF